jgi:hypothetical protein
VAGLCLRGDPELRPRADELARWLSRQPTSTAAG